MRRVKQGKQNAETERSQRRKTHLFKSKPEKVGQPREMQSQNRFVADERNPPAGPRTNTSKGFAFCSLIGKQKRLGVGTATADFE